MRIVEREKQIHADRERKAGALDPAKAERSPPGGRAGAETVTRQTGDVGDDARSHSSSSFMLFGQNQPISATAISALPHTAAKAEKIEAMKAIVVAIAAISGQIEESGDASRISGRASASV